MADKGFSQHKSNIPDQLNQETLNSLIKIWDKYIGYEKLLSNIIINSGKDKVSELIEVREVVRQLVDDVDGLIKKGRISNSPAVLKRIQTAIVEIDTGIKIYKESVAKNADLKDVLDQAEESAGTSIGDLEGIQKRTSKGFGGIGNRNGQGIVGSLKKAAPTAYNFGKAAIGGIVGATFGPFSGVVKGAWDTGKELLAYRKSLKEEKQNRGFAKALNPYARAYDANTYDRYAGLKTGSGLGGRIEGLGDYASPKSSFMDRAVSMFKPKYGSGEQSVPSAMPIIGSGEGSGNALFTFFNRSAYRAKWTSEVLEALKAMSGKGSGNGAVGNALGSALGPTIATALKSVLPLILPLAAFITAVAGFNKFLSWFKDKMPNLAKPFEAIASLNATIGGLTRPLDKLSALFGGKDKLKAEWGKEVSSQKDNWNVINKEILTGMKDPKTKEFATKMASALGGFVLDPSGKGRQLLGIGTPELAYTGIPGSVVSGQSVGQDNRVVDDLFSKFSGVLDRMMGKLESMDRSNSGPIVVPSTKGSSSMPTNIRDSVLDSVNSGTHGQER